MGVQTYLISGTAETATSWRRKLLVSLNQQLTNVASAVVVRTCPQPRQVTIHGAHDAIQLSHPNATEVEGWLVNSLDFREFRSSLVYHAPASARQWQQASFLRGLSKKDPGKGRGRFINILSVETSPVWLVHGQLVESNSGPLSTAGISLSCGTLTLTTSSQVPPKLSAAVK